MDENSRSASRRAFLQTGLTVTALTGLPALRAQNSTTPTIPTPPATTPVTAQAPTAMIGTLSAGDRAILRFSVAAEMMAVDIWSQYANQVLYNPAYTTALQTIDPMLPRLVLETFRDELSHSAFLTALAGALGVEAVNLDAFRTIADPGAAALTNPGQAIDDATFAGGLAGAQAIAATVPQAGTRRIVNLTQLNIDTSFFNKYRTSNNPDVQPETTPIIALRNQATIPTAQGGGALDTLLMAGAAVMHMAGNEQMEGSTYAALGALIQNRELLRVMASLMPVEMMHYTAFMSAVARVQNTGTGGNGGTGGTGGNGGTDGTGGTGTLADLLPGLRAQLNQIPLPILPAPAVVYLGLPPVSVVRPTTIPQAGAVATVRRLVAANYFQGQSPAFMTAMMQLAQAADAAGTVAVLGPKNLQTTEREIGLSTMGSLSGNGPLTYSVRPLQGSAAVIGGNTANPRVQFQGGYGYYTFELLVTDAMGNQSRDVTTVFYNGQF